MLRALLDVGTIRALRLELLESSELVASSYGLTGRRSHCGIAGLRVAGTLPLLATNFGGPVDVLAATPEDRRPSGVIRPRVWGATLPDNSTSVIREGVEVVSPELALQQLAVRADAVRTALLLSELLGTFSVYQAPGPLAKVLQELADHNQLPAYRGWRAARNNGGKLTGLWSRPPLLSLDRLQNHLALASSRGKRALTEAARRARVGAASPFEAQAGMLLAESVRHGGEGYLGLEHNRRVTLSADAKRLCGLSSCYCDLFWEREGGDVDVECQSSSHHFGSRSSVSDADRSTALQMMGIEVIQLTYAQMENAQRFEAFSRLLAEKLGVERQERTQREKRAQEDLRASVLVDWESLPDV